MFIIMPDLLAILIYSPRLSSIHAGLLTHRTRRSPFYYAVRLNGPAVV